MFAFIDVIGLYRAINLSTNGTSTKKRYGPRFLKFQDASS